MLPPFMPCEDNEIEYHRKDILADDEVEERCIQDSKNDYKISFIKKLDKKEISVSTLESNLATTTTTTNQEPVQ